ncbi:MAG: hypothetical protein HC822_26935 [Oscillochloris sp.]|nr:hypothetical protein [Oscillochloris sp.]
MPTELENSIRLAAEKVAQYVNDASEMEVKTFYVLVDGRFLLRARTLLTLDMADIVRRAQVIAERINTYLASREQDLLEKIAGIGGVRAAFSSSLRAKGRR